MKSVRFSPVRPSGFVLIELLVVLGIVGLLIAMGVYRARSASEQQKIIDEATDLRYVIDQTRKVFANSATFAGVTETVLTNLKVFPANRVVASGNANNAFSNGWTVAVGNVGGTNQSVSFTAAGYPDKACVDLATSLGEVFRTIDINTVNVKPATGPVVVTDVGANCGSTGNEDNNTIVWTFTKN